MSHRIAFFILMLSPLLFSSAYAKQTTTNQATITSKTTIEHGFSPDGSAEKLILTMINNAHQSIRVAAYAFTSPTISEALLKAKKRGVDVAVLVDHKQTIQMDTKGRGKAALNLLVNAKIPVRTLNTRNTQHNKYMVIDGQHVQTGSFNYSAAAARYNYENVLVVRHHPTLAKHYLENWQQLFKEGKVYKSTY